MNMKIFSIQMIKTRGFLRPVPLLCSATIVLMTFCGCIMQSKPSDSYASWFQTQQDIAKVLNKYNGGPRFKIVAITGAEYHLGTTFYGINGVSPDRRCWFKSEDIFTNDLTAWPEVFQTNTFGFDASVPFNWASAIGVGKAGANLNTQNGFHLKYANLRQVFVYDDTLLSWITNGPCLMSLSDIATCPRPILRGYYVGTLVVSSTKSFDIGANCMVTNVAGLDIKYSANQGFVIEQTNATPWFGIYSIIKAGKEYRKMTPEEMRGAISGGSGRFATVTSPNRPIETTVVQLAAPSDADAAILSQVK